jgi:hypothetical protein
MYDQQEPPSCPQATCKHEDVHTSVCLIRKWAYDALVEKDGYYLDEGFWMYANDCDLKLRLGQCGIHGAQTDIGCWHFGSSTWRLAPDVEQAAMLQQADRDREYFRRKFGFSVGSAEHVAAMVDLNFRI